MITTFQKHVANLCQKKNIKKHASGLKKKNNKKKTNGIKQKIDFKIYFNKKKGETPHKFISISVAEKKIKLSNHWFIYIEEALHHIHFSELDIDCFDSIDRFDSSIGYLCG